MSADPVHRLDQDGDGVPDLWVSGSKTHNTKLYPHYGAAAHSTGLFLAALRVGELLALERGDGESPPGRVLDSSRHVPASWATAQKRSAARPLSA